MSTNGGESMVVTGQTSAATQQGYAQQIAYNIQNNIPFSMKAAPNDAGAQAIASSILNQAQVLAFTPQIDTQVAASTTGSNPAGVSANILGSIAEGARVGSLGSAIDSTVTNPVTSWLQARAGNYGLVIMGGLLMLGALLISQRKNIETIVTTGAKVAAL